MTRTLLFFITLLFSIYINAQTTIVEEKFQKNNDPVGYRYLPNKGQFVIMKGKSATYPEIQNIYSYTKEGIKTAVVENQKKIVNGTFSATENSLKVYNMDNRLNLKLQYFLNGIPSDNFEKSLFKDVNKVYFGYYDRQNVFQFDESESWDRFENNFNDNYELGFSNQKGKSDIDFVKDDLYLETLDLKNQTKSKVKIEKPDLSLLIGEQFVKSEKYDLTFNCRLNNNDSFDMITKSISTDYKTVILYKTKYDMYGKKLETISFKTESGNSFFTFSNNKGGRTGVSYTDDYEFQDVLSINNYYEDQKTGDVYIYGLLSENPIVFKKDKLFTATYTRPEYYIFKFDKKGNKIWESILKVAEQPSFNFYLNVSLLEFNGKLIFSADYNDGPGRQYVKYAVVDKNSGNILKSNMISFNQNKGYYNSISMFICNTFYNKDLKKMAFSPFAFIALDLSPSYLNYIKKLNPDNRIYFETIFSNEGIWLLESDNEEYYKLNHFKE